MDLETIREVTVAGKHSTESAVDSETGSVWWAELLLGVACSLVAAVFALTYTTIGPFASYTVTYGTIPATLYFLVAVGLGLKFLDSGTQRAPLPIRSEGNEGGAAGDAGVVVTQDP